MNTDSPKPEKAVVKSKRQLSPIWLLPLIAAGIGLWLLIQGVLSAPVTVVINFQDAEGVIPNKTKVMYKGLQAGLVTAMEIDPDLKSVDVTVEFDRTVKPLIMNETEFWLVKPRVTLAGVSGLGTLLGGIYIAMRPKGDDPALEFKALPDPPLEDAAEGGLVVLLDAEDSASVSPGSPVYFKRIQVGRVQRIQLSPDDQKVEISIFIQPEFSYLVKKGTRFWNAGGIQVEGGLSGLKIRTETLTSILSGGIAFYTPDVYAQSQPAENGDRYRLYADFLAAETGIPITLSFPTGENLVSGQTKVMFKGIVAGHVRDIRILDDLSGVRTEIMMDPRAEPFLLDDTLFWLVEPKLDFQGLTGLETILKGSYINMHIGGKGGSKRQFVALSKAPPPDPSAAGLHITLTADELGAIAQGTAVYYKKMPVGSVRTYVYQPQTDKMLIYVHIEKEFEHLVKANSRFWNSSGISLSGGLSGLKLRMTSLATMLVGGIAFFSPEEDPDAAVAKDGDNYRLHPDYDSAHLTGPQIEITFPRAEGIQAGTLIKYRGMAVGSVSKVSFRQDFKEVLVTARLNPEAKQLIRTNPQFWIVEPQFGLAQVSNIGTLVSGKFIAVLPGKITDKDRVAFIGLESEPQRLEQEKGLTINLVSDTVGSAKVGNKVYFREIPVGNVTGVALAATADHVVIAVNIQERFAPLVRINSVFWNASGINIDWGLFKGAKVRMESMEALLAGGIAFATPPGEPELAPVAQPNSVFTLYKEPQSEWTKWKTRIDIEPNTEG